MAPLPGNDGGNAAQESYSLAPRHAFFKAYRQFFVTAGQAMKICISQVGGNDWHQISGIWFIVPGAQQSDPADESSAEVIDPQADRRKFRAEQGLDAPTEITDTDVAAIDRVMRRY